MMRKAFSFEGMSSVAIAGVLAVVAGAGCATQQYGFRPTEMVATQEAGYPASRYPVPPESPHGEVYVTSFGTRDVENAARARSQLVHVRMAVANNSGASTWFVDPGQQQLVAPGGPPQPPAFMEIDGRRTNDSSIARGQRRVFDFFYTIPGGAPDATRVPHFDFQWQVMTEGSRVYAQRTPFAREPYRDYWADSQTRVAVSIGPPWWAYWYGPAWGYYSWYGGWPYYYPYYGPYVGFGGGYYRGYWGGPRHYNGYRGVAPPIRSHGGGIGGGGFRGMPPGGGGSGFRGAPPAIRGVRR